MEAIAVGSWASKVGSYTAGFGAAGAAALPITVTVPKYVFFGLIPWLAKKEFVYLKLLA